MYLGLDFGSTGVRACVVDDEGHPVYLDRENWACPEHPSPSEWRSELHGALRRLPAKLAIQLKGIAIDATSATVLLCDENLEPLSPALMYSDARAIDQARQIADRAPHGSTLGTATSGLAKFLWLIQHNSLDQAVYFLHQADWIAALLTGQGGISDYHNALKSGYDTEHLRWPSWVMALPHAHLLPQVVEPGAAIATIKPSIAAHFGIAPDCVIHAGTTDSIAAFIATGANQPGDGVTSLGTTLVLKLLSEQRVEDAKYGIYSHRYGRLWLAGGASNAGGGILRELFSDAQLETLSGRLDPESDSPLDYYPLLHPGERFPINDPHLAPRLDPRPTDDAAFLHGVLQGLSRIEAIGYARLAELGTTPLRAVTTCGGGAKNAVWARIRERLLNVPVNTASQTEAAYGTALLARNSKLPS